MEPSDVAEAAFSLTQTRKLHLVLGSTSRLWHGLSGVFSMRFSRWLTRRIIG
jgi:hypothetical protein